MPTLLPSNILCHSLRLPRLDEEAQRTLSDAEKRALTLSCRTGAAVHLNRSSVFVNGGLTIPLGLPQVNSASLQQELILYFARERQSSSSFQNLSEWISNETFELDLISRKWERVVTNANPSLDERDSDSKTTAPIAGRIFHSMCCCDGFLYVFGGLVVSQQSNYEFIATNELWALDLVSRVWTLIGSDPSITRRFNHSMHVLNEEKHDKDTLIVIIGGLNNMDRPVHVVDVYNITQNRWESGDDSSASGDLVDLVANVDGQNTQLVKGTNFSLLMERNESQTSDLILYVPTDDTTDTRSNPLVSLPLMPNAKGSRMPFYHASEDTKKRLQMPFHLQYPSGGCFGQNIIISGFHPKVHSSNFHCFTYNIPSGKWTEISTSCDDSDVMNHNLGQLFVWKSHHKVVFLGSKDSSDWLPSIQTFDTIICISLPVISVFHQAIGYQLSGEKSGTSLDSTKSNRDNFESYSRYIAPPLEITSIASVLPSHAMALGKDALELYGKYLSDFEFITEEGDSVSASTFLLRKRWGRFFDTILAEGYVKASLEFESHNIHNEFTKLSGDSSSQHFSQASQHFDSIGSKEQPGYSQESVDETANKADVSALIPTIYPLLNRKSTPLFFANRPTMNGLFTPSRENPSEYDLDHSKSEHSALPSSQTSIRGPKEQSDQTNHEVSSAGSNKTTSSSTGMIFRLPFQECGETTHSAPTLQTSHSDPSRLEAIDKMTHQSSNRRKSSASASLLSETPRSMNRRASHPVGSTIDNLYPVHGSLSHAVSPYNSRKASITSQNSSISYVSSSSDRMGNSVNRQQSGESNLSLSMAGIGTINVNLPPPQPMPNEPVPTLPHPIQSDISSSRASAKNSPLSSRRSSLYHDALHSMSVPISQAIASQNISATDNGTSSDGEAYSFHKRSMDRQLMEDNLIDVELDPDSLNHTFSKSPLTKNAYTSRESSFYGKFPFQQEEARPSWVSVDDSNLSGASTAPNELEPLLLPRSLYMPWPTSTVRAFAEFFYTGQVNGKWLFSPISLNLFVMAKLYEVPLLYDLMSEVIYSIIGKKEESLLVTAESLKRLFLLKVTKRFFGDEETIKITLDNHNTYQEFLEFEQSLKSIDDGYFDLNLMKNGLRKTSTGTNESNDSMYGDKSTSRDSRDGTLPSIPILFAGGPRDSHNSIGSVGFPPNMNFPSHKLSHSYASKPNKKSSLSKEVNPCSSSSSLGDEVKREELEALKNESLREESNDSKLGPKSEKEDEIHSEEAEQQKLKNMSQGEVAELDTRLLDVRTTNCTDETEECQEPSEILAAGNTHDDNKKVYSSSSSDSGDLGIAFGSEATSKIEKKMRQRDADESVDPLAKIGDSQLPSIKNILSYFRQGDKSYKQDTSPNNVEMLTLDSMASPNALPPIDYILELIYDTSVLANDLRLIIRSMSCIKLSKRLKVLKRKLSHDIVLYDEEFKKLEKPLDIVERVPTNPAGKLHEKVPPTVKLPDTLTPTSSSEKLAKSLSSISFDKRSPLQISSDALRRSAGSSAHSSTRALSSEGNFPDQEAPAEKQSKPAANAPKVVKLKKVNSHLASSGLTGAGMFMGGSFGLTPAPSASGAKKKKDSTSSNTSGLGNFPFFGKKK